MRTPERARYPADELAADVRRRWRWLLVAAFAAGLATFSLLGLLVFDRLRDPRWLAVVLVVNAAGDLLAARAAELLAPTRIRLRPGERGPAEATVVAGFGTSDAGHVVTGGERWRARLQPGTGPIEPGRRVLVLEREGLVLIVAPAEDD